MSKRESIRLAVKAALAPLNIVVYTERQIENPPAEFAVIHMDEWSEDQQDFDGGSVVTSSLIIEYFANSDSRVDEMEEQAAELLRGSSLGGEVTVFLYESGQLGDFESGHPSTLVQTWLVKYPRP
ncbi:hypothetical protein [Endozoicomonas lisbonensis]|uniref:Phage tail protein n=1 Tax=Endozoicomonas lisbonensis TaxID=3120522 RepID=A0ABV2SFH2_9GAMM